MIYNFIELNEFISVIPFIDITHVHNYGISFGLFSEILPSWFIILTSFIILIFLILWILRSNNEIEKWGLLLIISGAIANVGDRIINNYVIDFIFLHYQNYSVSSSVFIGVIMRSQTLLLYTVMRKC